MKKILFLIHDLGHGGAEKVLVNLVNNMDTEKFDITVMSLFGGGVNEQFLSDKVKYKACFKKEIPGNSHLMKLLSPKQLHRWLIKERYDIEISYLEGPCARIISGCTDSGIKLVSWIHIEQLTKKNACRAFRNYEESLACYKKFDKTICVSETVKRDYLGLYDLNSPVDVLFNTNESKQIVESSKNPAEELLDDGFYRMIGVGKVVKNKGFDRLARIHKRLREDGIPVHTYILGVGDKQNEIERYIKENELTDTFTFLGYQTNPYKYVAKCDLFVCSSYAEGFSTAATEALIVGTPVCTVEVSGMREMLGEDNEYGVVCENSEEGLYHGLKSLLSDPAKLSHYKEKAAIRGKSFSTENTVRAVENMLLAL